MGKVLYIQKISIEGGTPLETIQMIQQTLELCYLESYLSYQIYVFGIPNIV